ncbi:uncharacterized protein cusr [Paramormyrops kingsleyae]|uniref:uncharacterized protein cusr n=1 Tax=Paramormyrops kingsleyae TaxID=1676925 RepID=UPI000CD5D85F|nr:uncharacterized protein LOC111848382 [Paramormyrops kingsleyae]
MCLSLLLPLLNLWGAAHCVVFQASINMAGMTGQVTFDSSLGTATLNLTGAQSPMNISLAEFPVMYGHFLSPCREASVGPKVFTFAADGPQATVDVSDLFRQRPSLDDLSLVVEMANGMTACGNVRQNVSTRTWQARFFHPVAGDVYIRQNVGENATRVLSGLITLRGTVVVANVTVYVSQSSSPTCKALINNLKPSDLSLLGDLAVGSPVKPVRCCRDVQDFIGEGHFLLLKVEETYTCSKIREMEEKVVHALIDMKGTKGTFTFSQVSPFDVTEVRVNLMNTKNLTRTYHVHQFPMPESRSTEEDVCSHDNVGDHWNPHKVTVSDPAYPHGPGATHDMYEVGDLSGRHGSLDNISDVEQFFSDWNLPLFGTNSIVGRSVVIHQSNGARLLCGTIGYPGEVMVLKSVFRNPVVGTIYFTQLKSNKYTDVSIFMDLSYGNSSAPVSNGHNWHIHQWPISTETDSNESSCGSTGNHWNPFKINISDSSYTTDCRPDNPFACEIGDLTGKNQPISITPVVGKFRTKYFVTDTTSWTVGADSMIGRSVVIHETEGNAARLACANITAVHLVKAQSGTWFGSGTSEGHVQFSQDFPGLTTINVSLSNLNWMAGGYHVHKLPINSTVNPCSDRNIMGHFNPLAVNQSSSPPPGNGTVDQYEIGDISGKFGLLIDQDQSQNQYQDCNMPLTGPNSIVGRSLVIHYLNGSRMQCANIVADNSSDGFWVKAKVVFGGAVTGTIKLSQQAFKDGSHGDSLLEVDIHAAQEMNVTEVSWSIHSHRTGEDIQECSDVGDQFNPFNISSESASCSARHPLHCEVGDLTNKHGPVDLTIRQLFTDANLQLTGDFTVMYRSVVLWSGNGILSCADILPFSPSATLIFPKVTSFSRFDFRSRVAAVLDVDLWRVTILPDELSPVPGSTCQQVTFLVSGDVNKEVLNSVKDNEKMGPFKQSQACPKSGSSGRPEINGRLLMLIITAHIILCLLQ